MYSSDLFPKKFDDHGICPFATAPNSPKPAAESAMKVPAKSFTHDRPMYRPVVPCCGQNEEMCVAA